MLDTTIIQVINTMAMTADNRDWQHCQNTFAENVYVDYTSMAGGEPATILADDLIASWKGLLPGFTATQHLIGSHVITVDKDVATCQAHFQATHILDDDTWTLGGKYDFKLAYNHGNWKITAITMTALWSVGDQARLLQLAAERA